TFLALFLMGGAGFANAQGRGHQQHRGQQHGPKHQVTRVQHSNRQPARYAGKSHVAKYYSRRENAYRKYIKQHHKHYRDHDRWYYAPKFYHHNQYVYFPAYHTYYDPFRRVYIYRDHNRWIPTPNMPSLLVGLNLGNVQVQFMSRLPF